MFSRFHHRRAPSTPTSPLPDQLASWDAAALPEKQQPRLQHDSLRPQSSSSAAAGFGLDALGTPTDTSSAPSPSVPAPSSMPPSLPPIARVTSMASVSSDRAYDFFGSETSPPTPGLADTAYSAPSSSLDTRRPPQQAKAVSPQMPQSPTLGDTGFIGGVALANLRRAQDPSTAAAVAAAAAAAATATASKTAARPSSSAGHPISPTSPPRTGAAMRTGTGTPQSYGVPERRLTRSKPPPPPINTTLASRSYLPAQPAAAAAARTTQPLQKTTSSFVAPTDLHVSAAAAAASAISAASAASAAVAANHDTHGTGNAAAGRSKKGLPFLNSMSSLLSRRKPQNNPTDVSSSIANADGPIYAPIRGTRFHDFSAPRPRRVIPTDSGHGMAAAAAAAATAASIAVSPSAVPLPATSAATSPIALPSPKPTPNAKDVSPSSPHRQRHALHPSQQLQLQREKHQEPQPPSYSSSRDSSVTPDAAQNNVGPTTYARQSPDVRAQAQAQAQMPPQHMLQTLQENRPISFDEKPLPERPVAQDSPRNSAAVGPASIRSSSTRSRTVSADVSSLLKSTPSTTTSHSQNLSMSDFSPNPNAAVSSSTSATTPASAAPPRPMKSTSSRFSFMVGSASEEKLLEERHRQKELERKSMYPSEPAHEAGTRDSRFDDFDEDFDYDAMMDDDGLEERIPGVNADAEEEDYPYEEEIPYTQQEIAVAADDDPEGLDPDNDQQNFAGFVFQRSNPSSSLVTPITGGMAATPRDAGGRVIGFALSKDETADLGLPSASSHELEDTHSSKETIKEAIQDEAADALADSRGLGIQHAPAGQRLSRYHLELPVHEWQEQRSEVDWSPQFQAQQHAQQRVQPSQPHISSSMAFQPSAHEDELYFDQGLADELDFGQPESSAPFDESIFDNNDTDQYGRPIPGAFALAKAQRERASDPNASSRMSEQSMHAQSTARTSLSAGCLPFAAPPSEKTDYSQDGISEHEGLSHRLDGPFEHAPDPTFTAAPNATYAAVTEQDNSLQALRRQLPPLMTDAQRVAAYQAALAEAAYQAAASGKFRRDSSPPPAYSDLGSPGPALRAGSALGESAIATSPTAAAVEKSVVPDAQADLDYAYTSHGTEGYEDDYDDGEYTQNMDDYDFDDDAIIAEANAEALANDSDGFYGQEFNFYSAPVPIHHHGAGSAPSAPQVQFANGGYFVPTGVGRSTSGRVVSREPNLTPITERSEYSNRNSVMSLGLPPLGSSADIRSPGLAQLAMLADDSDMSMSALMRLRNKTFGGSQASLPLSSREGSPMAGPDRDRDREGASSPWGFSGYPDSNRGSFSGGVGAAFAHQHGRKNSATSFSVRGSGSGRDSETGSDNGSPTLTNFQQLAIMSPSPVPLPLPVPLTPSTFSPGTSNLRCPPVQEEEDEALQPYPYEAQTGGSSLSGSGLWMRIPATSSGDAGPSSAGSQQGFVASPTSMAPPPPPTEAPPPVPPLSGRRAGMGHRHKGSADSISYTKEEESSGETRWVMERRRMADSGEVEILEREVVEGGRI